MNLNANALDTEGPLMAAKIGFDTREEANQFAKLWTRYSLKGPSVSPLKDGQSIVTIWGATESEIEWVKDTIANWNNS